MILLLNILDFKLYLEIKAILKDKHLNEEDVMLMTLDKDGNINILKKDKEK